MRQFATGTGRSAWWMKLWASLCRSDVVAGEPPPGRRDAVPAHGYAALSAYLDKRYAEMVVLTFGEIEDLLGFPLPAQARADGLWWTGPGTSDSHPQTAAWRAADRTAVPNVGGQTVAFERRVSNARART